MNCKQGDLAIIVKSYAGNEGKIVRCVRFIGITNFRINGVLLPKETWDTDFNFGYKDDEHPCGIPDDQLRPIRDSDKEDEMLRIVGKPEKETC